MPDTIQPISKIKVGTEVHPILDSTAIHESDISFGEIIKDLSTYSGTVTDNDLSSAYAAKSYVEAESTLRAESDATLSEAIGIIEGKIITQDASKVSTGSGNKPVYVNADNKVVECNFTVNKSVPTDAVFTDTWQPNTSSAAGYVVSGAGQVNKVWKTDANGNPAWREDSSISLLVKNTWKEGQIIESPRSGVPLELRSRSTTTNDVSLTFGHYVGTHLDSYGAIGMDETHRAILKTDSKKYIATDDVVDSKVADAVSTKQDTLVSGTNIKTVNGDSLLGSGNITTLNASVSGTKLILT